LRENLPKWFAMAKKGRIYVNQSVSFPPQLLAAAKRRAKNLGLSFSTYVQKCLERDLAERPPIIFAERADEGHLAVAEEPPRKGGRRPPSEAL
jgi:hypothetical protein